MAEPISDDRFASYARNNGLATPDQIQAARDHQAEQARRGAPIPLADALVRIGVITPPQRETAEGRIRNPARGGVQHLLHYRLIKKLGEGGMGAVYLAEDTQQKRRVALKVLPRQHAGNTEFMKRFQREADAMGRLHHANIVRAFSVGEDQGRHFYVMEYCEGETLDKRLERESRLPAAQAVGIMIQVARGLQYAHAQGFVHRDIKPANVILGTDGVVKILDLGLTKNVEGAQSTFLTQSGIAIGTPHYIAPEQARGERELDGRADVYSLGATFYHVVTGDTPFHGSSPYEVVTKHLNDQLPDPRDLRPDVPEGVVHVIRRMMAKRRQDRYRDCGELLGDLELVAAGKAPASRSVDAALTTVAMRGAKRTPSRRRGRRAASRPVAARAASPVPPGKVGCFIVTKRAAYGIGLAVLAVLVPVAVISNLPEPASEGGHPRADATDKSLEVAKAPAPTRPGEPRRRKETVSNTADPGSRAVRKGQSPRAPAGASVTDELKRAQPGGTPVADGKANLLAGEKAGSAKPAATPPPPAAAKADTAEAGRGIAQVASQTRGGETIESQASAWAMALDLTSLIDLNKDVVKGTWTLRDGSLSLSKAEKHSRIRIPYRPPEAYDFRIRFTRREGAFEVAQLLVRKGRPFAWLMGVNNRIKGFETVGQAPVGKNPTTVTMEPSLETGREHVAVVQVRPAHVTAFLDGKSVARWKPEHGALGLYGLWKKPDPASLGLGCSSPTIFHAVEILEVSGRGAFTRPDDPAAREAERKRATERR